MIFKHKLHINMDFLNKMSESLSGTLGGVLPNILGALITLLLGIIIAGILRKVVKTLFKKTNLDERLGAKVGMGDNLGNFVATLVYYLVVIFTLMLVLGMMGVDSVLQPLKDMMSAFMGFIPNIIAAGVIGYVGHIIAKLVSEATGFISDKVEGYASGLATSSKPTNIPKIIKSVVYVLIFVPILISALDALKIKAISEPATDMFNTFLAAIPNLLAAGILMAVFYFVGSFISKFAKDFLSNMGVDAMLQKSSFGGNLQGVSLSSICGKILFFFILMIGAIAAVDKLDIPSFGLVLNQVLTIASKVFFGVVIMVAGGFLASFVGKLLSQSQDNAWFGSVAKFAIIGIFMAFALHTMGIAESIVNLAFGLTLGAIAVAFALAFGLGGRETAGKQVESLFNKINNGKKEKLN